MFHMKYLKHAFPVNRGLFKKSYFQIVIPVVERSVGQILRWYGNSNPDNFPKVNPVVERRIYPFIQDGPLNFRKLYAGRVGGCIQLYSMVANKFADNIPKIYPGAGKLYLALNSSISCSLASVCQAS